MTHFFNIDEINSMFGNSFTTVAVDTINRSDNLNKQQIEEFHCQFKKAT